MLAERNGREVQEKILHFMNSGPDEGIITVRLMGTKPEPGEVETEFILAFFPADPNLEKMEFGVYKGPGVVSANSYFRQIFTMEFGESAKNHSEGTIDDLLSEVRKSLVTGLPLFTMSFGHYRDSGNQRVCIHTVRIVPPKFVFDALQRYSEIELFGKKLSF